MPKMKSNSGAKKRFRKTGGGKYRRGQKGKRHLLTRKSQKRKRHLRKQLTVHKADEKRLERLIPYA